ncbi:BTB/POZ domain protein [Cotonvirus japonicus]|uniref:BTB/POZ domain protein n=1 Tax=Cotonvirus japonicus TaxID=2811091 RepID=A0ABM7NRV0_9VIRU|nr:BTB/POZ domain protein [Cotonvirus japonicus]BCS82826.1 BTB/POZ domain protein [Cotonvirus japonicus]
MSQEIIIQTNNATICTTYSTISNIKLFTDNVQINTNTIYLNIDSIIVDTILNNVRQGLNAFTNYENYDFTMCTNRDCVLINIGGRKFYLPKNLLLDFEFFNEILSGIEFDHSQILIDRSPRVFDKIIDLVDDNSISNTKILPQDIVNDLRFYGYRNVIGQLFIDNDFSRFKINNNIYDASLGCDYDIGGYEDYDYESNIIFTNNTGTNPTYCMLWFDKYLRKNEIESIAEKIKLNTTPLSEYYSHSLEKFDPIYGYFDLIEPYCTTTDLNGHTIVYFLFPNVLHPVICIPKNCGIVSHKLVREEYYHSPNVGPRFFTKYFAKTSVVEIDLHNILNELIQKNYDKNPLIHELYIYSQGVNYTYAEIVNNDQIVCRSTLSKFNDCYSLNLFAPTKDCISYILSVNDNSKLILYSDKETDHEITLRFA